VTGPKDTSSPLVIAEQELAQAKHARHWWRPKPGHSFAEAVCERAILDVRVAAMQVFLGSDCPDIGPRTRLRDIDNSRWCAAAQHELDSVCHALEGGPLPSYPQPLSSQAVDTLLFWRVALKYFVEWVSFSTKHDLAAAAEERCLAEELSLAEERRLAEEQRLAEEIHFAEERRLAEERRRLTAALGYEPSPKRRKPRPPPRRAGPGGPGRGPHIPPRGPRIVNL
jgi:hypothetical protein